MRVLVTNDDGVDAPGLHALAAALREDWHDVVVVAPMRDHSGYGAAIGPLHLTGQVAYERVADEVIAVDGPPALCVLAACLGGFGDAPAVVVSGINAGANTGRAVLHSGTVGAALTANNFGVPAIAVSQVLGAHQHWDTAAAVATSLVDWVADLSRAITLNVNVPNRAPGRIAAQAAVLDTGGEVQSTMVEAGDGIVQLRMTPGAPQPGTDAAVLEAGFVAITPLAGVRPAEVVVTDALDCVDGVFAAAEHVA